MEELTGNVSFWIALFALIGSIITGAYSVRSQTLGATGEISKAYSELLNEHRMKLDSSNQKITDLEQAITTIERDYQDECNKLHNQVRSILADYAILERKHNQVVTSLGEERTTNKQLLERIRRLEKGETGPLAKGKD